MRKQIGLFLGPLAFAAIYFAPFTSLAMPAHRLAAILLWVVIYWVTEAIPLPATALLGAALSIVLGVEKMETVLAPFANPVIFLCLGSLLLAHSMERNRLDRRVSLWCLSRLGSSSHLVLMGAVGLAYLISWWIANTAATVILLSVTLGVFRSLEKRHALEPPLKEKVLIFIAYATSVGGIATPVGTPTNLIGLGLIRELVKTELTFLQWMMFGIPISLAALLLLVLSTRFWKSKKVKADVRKDFLKEEKALGPLSVGERNTLFAFFCAVVLWLLPGVLALVLGNQHPLVLTYNRLLPEAMVAIVAALLLFLLPVSLKKMEFTLPLKSFGAVDWGTLVLFGGGISLGSLMFSTGLAEHIGRGVVDWMGVHSLWGITFFGIFISVLLSELTSNVASASMVVPVVIAVAQTAGVDPLPPAIGATLAASFGFMLPVSTPPNALVYATGQVRITRMIRYGILLDLIGIGIIWLGLRLYFG